MADSDPDAADLGADAADPDTGVAEEDAETSIPDEELRERVETEYDFEDFGPADMAEMSVEEWEAAFDADTWITGDRLLDRVEADLKSRVKRRDVFAVVEREDDVLLAYNDVEYAIVRPDGSVEGEGSLRRTVEPIVALCSMDDYDVPELPEGQLLPDPADIDEGTGQLGNTVLQVVAGTQVLAGLFILVSPLLPLGDGAGSVLLTTVVGLAFVVVGILLFVLVANARLADRFRAEEYRERLRAAGVGTDRRPAFLDDDDGDPNGSS